MPQVPGADLGDTDQARDDKSLDVYDLKDEDEGVEKDVDVQGNNKMSLNICNTTENNFLFLDSNENNGSDADTVIINDYVECDSLEEDLQRAISTAERRKVFLINFCLA